MAVPKHRTSVSRQGMRRAHHALKGTQLKECPNCGEKTNPHHVCSRCGYYRGRQIVVQKTPTKTA